MNHLILGHRSDDALAKFRRFSVDVLLHPSPCDRYLPIVPSVAPFL